MVLKTLSGVEHSDYINASFVDVSKYVRKELVRGHVNVKHSVPLFGCIEVYTFLCRVSRGTRCTLLHKVSILVSLGILEVPMWPIAHFMVH